MPFVAFLDANVLYPAVLRDVLLSIAEAGVFQIRWSPDVLDEMEHAVARRVARTTSQPARAQEGAAYVRRLMEESFPEAMVERGAYARLIPSMTNDPKDRHVLAAAVAGRADVLVTFNVKHFPPEACQPYGIEVQDPDTFLVHQFGLVPNAISRILQHLARNRRPPIDTPAGLLRALSKHVPRFCQMAAKHLAG